MVAGGCNGPARENELIFNPVEPSADSSGQDRFAVRRGRGQRGRGRPYLFNLKQFKTFFLSDFSASTTDLLAAPVEIFGRRTSRYNVVQRSRRQCVIFLAC